MELNFCDEYLKNDMVNYALKITFGILEINEGTVLVYITSDFNTLVCLL